MTAVIFDIMFFHSICYTFVVNGADIFCVEVTTVRTSRSISFTPSIFGVRASACAAAFSMSLVVCFVRLSSCRDNIAKGLELVSVVGRMCLAVIVRRNPLFDVYQQLQWQFHAYSEFQIANHNFCETPLGPSNHLLSPAMLQVIRVS